MVICESDGAHCNPLSFKDPGKSIYYHEEKARLFFILNGNLYQLFLKPYDFFINKKEMILDNNFI